MLRRGRQIYRACSIFEELAPSTKK